MHSSGPSSHLDELRRECGCEWLAISRARELTRNKRDELRGLIASECSADSNLVVYGSMAREEMTSDSDLDWTLLLDKPVDPADLSTTQRIASKLSAAKFVEPGKTNIFGTMTSSHSLVHDICGHDDTNANTTRRILLLIESYVPSSREAYDRVRRHILYRYVEDDYGHSLEAAKQPYRDFFLTIYPDTGAR
jgi:predicted nucleotidyltransferase